MRFVLSISVVLGQSKTLFIRDCYEIIAYKRTKKMATRFFATESVTEGHPDKVCDRISDSVLDALLRHDENARCACETAVTTQHVLVMGEITANANIDIEKTVRDAVRDIGYTKKEYGFDCDNLKILNLIHTQSPDIAMGVDESLEAKEGAGDGFDIGAGDQGMVFGFACRETENLMPLGYSIATNLSKKLTAVRKSGEIGYLRPDGKTQVTVQYDGDTPLRLDNIVVSAQHDPDATQKQIREDIIEKVIYPVVPKHLIDANTKIYVNPTGRFVVGGPDGDSGLTGRKIIVDTYGGYSRHGGGAFSGKDATKVDRSACYAARYAAKNIIASGVADRCEVQIAYAIGVAHPLCINVNTFGTGKVSDERIAKALRETVDFRPAAIISYFGLRKPIFTPLSAYGHFGREELGVRFEKTDIAGKLADMLGLRV